MSSCPKCFAEIKMGHRFCTQCGCNINYATTQRYQINKEVSGYYELAIIANECHNIELADKMVERAHKLEANFFLM